MTRLRLLALLLVTFAMPTVALADDPEPEVSDQTEEAAATSDPMHLRWDRLLGVALTGGVDTPYGVIGGQLLVQPVRNLRIDLGGGVSRDGGRVAGGVTLVLPQDHFALLMRLGFAGGPLTWDEGRDTQIRRSWDFAAFLDTNLALEYRFDEGVLIQLAIGVETALNDTSTTCSIVSGTPETVCSNATVHDHPARLFGGLTVGYMFDFYP